MYYVLLSKNSVKDIDNNNVIHRGTILDQSKVKNVGEYIISSNNAIGEGKIELVIYNFKKEEPIILNLGALNGVSLQHHLLNEVGNIVFEDGSRRYWFI